MDKNLKLWNTFVKGYKNASNSDLRTALKKCGGPKGAYTKWKNSYVGGSILDSINEWLYNFVAKPAAHAIKNRFSR